MDNEKPPFTKREVVENPKRAGRIAGDPEKLKEHVKRKAERSKGRSSGRR